MFHFLQFLILQRKPHFCYLFSCWSRSASPSLFFLVISTFETLAASVPALDYTPSWPPLSLAQPHHLMLFLYSCWSRLFCIACAHTFCISSRLTPSNASSENPNRTSVASKQTNRTHFFRRRAFLYCQPFDNHNLQYTNNTQAGRINAHSETNTTESNFYVPTNSRGT